MKNQSTLLSLAFILSLSFSLHAEEPKNHPCEKIKTACESAGFVKGDHKDKKGLYIDCMKPFLEGQSVSGVSINSDDVSACKEKRAKDKDKKEAKK